ncbi:MAG: YdcF family protein [Bryobacterales bacterium]|nr:YdcF family protein [Bryobacterales bacterium]
MLWRGLRLWLVIAIVASIVAVGAVTVRVARQATLDEARPADAILILGAAEYHGKPSPVLKARLDHGLDLYRRHLAPRILTTGGSGGDPVFTEGEVGRDYLISRGVPPEAVIVEDEGSSTSHSIAATGEILRRMNLNSCIVVTDGYHVYRAKRMLQMSGIQAFGSPRPTTPKEASRQWWQYARQAAAYLLWRAGVAI